MRGQPRQKKNESHKDYIKRLYTWQAKEAGRKLAEAIDADILAYYRDTQEPLQRTQLVPKKDS